MRAFLPDQTRISQVHLRTANLESALAFYAGVLGLTGFRGPGSQAALSTASGPALLVLTEDRLAIPREPHSAGLHHLALRYPHRQNLANAYGRIMSNGYPIARAIDHGVSEAIYLNDPEGNGVELYTDRPRAHWHPHDGQITMETKALDLGNLHAMAADESATLEPPILTDIGHLHFHVADLALAERFYSEFLGLAVTQRPSPNALFLTANSSSHHHLGVDLCTGAVAPARNSVGLISYRLEVPVAEILYCLDHRAPLLGFETRTESLELNSPILQIRDPNGHWLEIQPSSFASEAVLDSRCPTSKLRAKISAYFHGNN